MSGVVTWSPLIPWPLLAAAGGAGLVLLLMAARGRARGIWWRGAVLALLVVVLADPRLVREAREAQNDIAVIALDTSPSQNTGTRQAQSAGARDALKKALDEIEGLEVRITEVGGLGPDSSEGTHMFGALEKAVAEIPAGRFAGAVLITDGQVHDAPLPGAKISVPGPVHVLLSGSSGEKDRRIVIESAPSYGIVGKEITLAYRIGDHPHQPRGTTADVVARRDGKDIESHSAPIGERREITLTLDHAGPTIVELSAAPLAGELSELNNRALVAINGVRDRLRVLLVSGQPHPGERTWRNLLKSDPAVDLVHFTILRPPEKDDYTPTRELALIAFPVQELFEERIGEFDLIVLDRYVVRNVLPPDYFMNIVSYVRGGGALLLAVGPEFAGLRSLSGTPLADILPVVPTGRIFETGFRPTTTDTGRRHPVTAALPAASMAVGVEPAWGRWFRQIEGAAGTGHVLMNGTENSPLLVLNRVGDGRVGQMMSDHIWLWARGFDGGGPHAEITRRLAHWLMKEPDLEEEMLRASARDGKLTIQRRSLGTNAVSVTVSTPSGSSQTLSLKPGRDGLASATLAATQPGLYSITDGTHTVLAALGALNAPELTDLRATAERLKPLSDMTGGATHWIADGLPGVRRTQAGRNSAGRGWIGFVRNEAEVVSGITRTPLLPWWLALSLTLGLLATAWWREGR